MERALMCPQCNAPLTPHKFARSVVCVYCGATVQLDGVSISAETFHKAFRIWNSPVSYQIPTWISVGDSHWAIKETLAQGDISNVYFGYRARWPTELVVIKILRDYDDIGLFDKEWETCEQLQESNARGADLFTTLLPQPVLHGNISQGLYVGQRVNIFRWVSGFTHTFENVIQTYPQGIPPRASIWVWRRILEALSFLHHSNMVHGAVLPSHLLVQENEHGVRLVGYSVAGQSGDKLRFIPPQYETFYPKSNRSLSIQLDLTMSARCIIYLLRGNPETGTLPKAVPPRLATLVQQVALSEFKPTKIDAWSIREELGKIAEEVFGKPQFIPIVMPS